ncbi:Metallopeptidase M20, partial [Cladochytrium tenue]
WLGTEKPCLTYGLRGVSYYTIEIKGPARDLHSGVFGGTVHEPMTDLVYVLGQLVDVRGRILIPGVYDEVAPVTEQELALYDGLAFSLGDVHAAAGAPTTIHRTEREALMARWRFPSLSVHGIEGAFSGQGAKTVIPARVVGKFSIRTVPNMDPDRLTEKVVRYLEGLFASLGSKNSMRVECLHAGKSWVADVNHWNYLAAFKAIERVYGVRPDYTREGGSIPVTLTFQETLQRSVLLLPMGRADDGAHSTNEKLDRRNYIDGMK